MTASDKRETKELEAEEEEEEEEVDQEAKDEKTTKKAGKKDGYPAADANDGEEGETQTDSQTQLLQMLRKRGPCEESRRHTAREHPFWDTQPVPSMSSEYDQDAGPLDELKTVDDVRPEPYPLPGQFEWCTCNVDDDAEMQEVYTLLTENYVEDDDSMFRFDYSIHFLRWALKPPEFLRNWHLGVRVKGGGKLVGFITGIPAKMRAATIDDLTEEAGKDEDQDDSMTEPGTPELGGGDESPLGGGIGKELHGKSDTSKDLVDKMHTEMIGVRSDMSQHHIRLEHIEGVKALKALESERSGIRDPDEDLQLVLGGWTEGRKGDVEGEVREIFRTCGLEGRISEIIIPYIRTNFAKAPEIDWRGRLYVGATQAIAEAHLLPNDAHPSDVYMTDNRGDHSGWVVLASRFHTITGYPPEDLPTWWDKGKHLEDLQNTADLLQLGSMDIIGLQELGGCKDVAVGKWDKKDLGLAHTTPRQHTWSNTRGSHSSIDYVLYRTPHQDTLEQEVVEDSDHLIQSDHKLCRVCVSVVRSGERRRARQQRTKCGKWIVDYTKAVPQCNDLACRADLDRRDLTEEDFLKVCAKSTYRPRSFRFKDPPEIKDLISQRKQSSDPIEKRQLGREIVRARGEAKKNWRIQLLDRAASGDYQVISYFRRKQNVSHCQHDYCCRVGGAGPAVGGLKAFYQTKYAPPDICPLHDPLHIYDNMVGPRLPGPALLSKEELETVLLQTKSGKSAGEDGAPYEFWCAVLQSEASEHLLEFLNDVLLCNRGFPAQWLQSQIVLLPKIKEPRAPKDFRPIVLAATLSKLLTKALLLRLREHFPVMLTGQLSSQPGAQSLDGSVALKHAIHLSRQWGLPLMACKLDVQAAFDTLDHCALAKFLGSLGPHQESRLLLSLIVQTSVKLSFCNQSWVQKLRRGILQGSAFSAELFARCLDHFLGPLVLSWESQESTWLRDSSGRPLFLILYADDLLVLATCASQLERLLDEIQATLDAIGLSLARNKCQYIQSPDLCGSEPVCPRGFEKPLELVDSFTFLGILVGFSITCQMTLSARLRMATNSFFGYLSFLSRSRGSLVKRLHLLDSFVTSRWRWLSAAVRPLHAVAQQLRTLQTHFLMSMTRLPPDPLQTSCENWASRRRASRMAAQSCGNRPWDAIHLESFMNYWGHAARLDPALRRPISHLMQVRNASWLATHPHAKRKKGKWPNAVLSLEWLWYRSRLTGDPNSWEQAAQYRDRWKAFADEVFRIKGLLRDQFYPDLRSVDLCRRCLLRTGDRFWLLPQTHAPIDRPYPSSFEHVLDAEDQDDIGHFCIACDGSRKGVLMGAGVALLPPYGEVPSDVVIAGYPISGGPSTNIKAELIAATKALEMALRILERFPGIPVLLQTDSAYVLQVLEGGTVGFAHVSLQAGLCMLWHRCRSRVRAMHVRAHKGHALNELADRTAKQALEFPAGHYFVRTLDASRAFVPPQNSALPAFCDWW
ncbi:nmt [Symbiodinium sp. CCMP2592]|nr:nmt [Symbiodinium sp. CCMP2592]